MVNGSPTQTAIGDRAGAGSQIAQLVFAGIVLLVLVVGTGPLQYLPRSALAAIVFAIAVEMIDIRGLRDSRLGNDLTYRFPLIVETLARLRSRSCIMHAVILV